MSKCQTVASGRLQHSPWVLCTHLGPGQGQQTPEAPLWCRPWQVTDIPAMSRGSCSQLAMGSPAPPVNPSSWCWPLMTQEPLRGSGSCPGTTQCMEGRARGWDERLSWGGQRAGHCISAVGREGKQGVIHHLQPLSDPPIVLLHPLPSRGLWRLSSSLPQWPSLASPRIYFAPQLAFQLIPQNMSSELTTCTFLQSKGRESISCS